MLTDCIFYAAAIPAVLISAINKGGFGSGVGVVAVPLMALTVPPLQAAAILLPILIAIDAVSVWFYRNTWDRAALRIMLPGAIVGVGLGMLTADLLSSAAIRLILGAICVIFTLNYWIGKRAKPTAQRSNSAGRFWGGVAGYTSFLAHAGGPAIGIYLLPQKLDKSIFVGTTVMFWATVNLVKVAPYALLGQFDATNLATSAVLAPLVPLGVGIGIWMNRRISPNGFYRVCYTLVFAVGLKLLWDGLRH